MMHVPGKKTDTSFAYSYFYFTSDQWLYSYASGLSVRENRLSACLDEPDITL